MTPRKPPSGDKLPKVSELTDTGRELLAIAAEDADAKVRELREELTGETPMQHTPTPAPVTHSEVYRISEEVAKRRDPAHMRDCEKEGPAATLASRMDSYEAEQKELRKEVEDMRTMQKVEQAKVSTTVKIVGAAITVAMLLVNVAQFAANRLWPPVHAAQGQGQVQGR